MKRKIVGIFVCMLLTATVVSATNFNKKNNIQTAVSTVDVPEWEVGDSWTYNEMYNQTWYDKNGDIFFQWYHNCTNTYTVTAEIGDTYTVEVISSNDEGSLRYGSYRLKFTPSVKFIETFECRKTDLAYIRYAHQEKGFASLSYGKIGLSIPAQYYDIWEASFAPGLVYLPFPFTAGSNGIIPICAEDGHENMGLYWGLINFIYTDFHFFFLPLNYTCEMAEITVPAGTYNAYNVSTDIYFGSSHNYTRIYYVPEVGYYVKYIDHKDSRDPGKPTEDYKYELVSTTYKP